MVGAPPPAPGMYGITAAPSAPSQYAMPGGGQQYSPGWAANQSQFQFGVGQNALQGVAAQVAAMLQGIQQMFQNPTGNKNTEAQKLEAAQLNAGATQSAVSSIKEGGNALGADANSPGLAAAQGQAVAQGGQNLQSAYTQINEADAQTQQRNKEAALQSLMQLMGIQANLAGNVAQHSQQQQFPILAPDQRGGAGGPVVQGPNRTGQYGSSGAGLQLSGVKAQRYTELSGRPWESLSGWERMELRGLQNDLGL